MGRLKMAAGILPPPLGARHLSKPSNFFLQLFSRLFIFSWGPAVQNPAISPGKLLEADIFSPSASGERLAPRSLHCNSMQHFSLDQCSMTLASKLFCVCLHPFV